MNTNSCEFRPTMAGEAKANEAALGRFLRLTPGSCLPNAVNILLNDLASVLIEAEPDGEQRFQFVAASSHRAFSFRMPSRPGYEGNPDYAAHLRQAEADLEAFLITATEAMNAAMDVIRDADPDITEERAPKVTGAPDPAVIEEIRAEVIAREEFGVLSRPEGAEWPEADNDLMPWMLRVARLAYRCYGADPEKVIVAASDHARMTDIILVPRSEGAGAEEKRWAHSALRKITSKMAQAASIPDEIMSVMRHIEAQRKSETEFAAALSALKYETLTRLKNTGIPPGAGWGKITRWLSEPDAPLSGRNPVFTDYAHDLLKLSRSTPILVRRLDYLTTFCGEIVRTAERERVRSREE